ncbi:hypothetical protein KFL_004380050 [Klebsormidium nitens]|uniref:Uncharacterized protein n=1 Tax=Klebsormidium nitens TaxID=105231 RepID=A0A1Y1IC59_KLENI|nr:hypothetical protein KFL_004380050 [Klebsormidium nitens]|eukprot:GAQ88545.1 hypothetical protein KFL_004380050 [Klebsormidium nitens]
MAAPRKEGSGFGPQPEGASALALERRSIAVQTDPVIIVRHGGPKPGGQTGHSADNSPSSELPNSAGESGPREKSEPPADVSSVQSSGAQLDLPEMKARQPKQEEDANRLQEEGGLTLGRKHSTRPDLPAFLIDSDDESEPRVKEHNGKDEKLEAMCDLFDEVWTNKALLREALFYLHYLRTADAMNHEKLVTAGVDTRVRGLMAYNHDKVRCAATKLWEKLRLGLNQ